MLCVNEIYPTFRRVVFAEIERAATREKKKHNRGIHVIGQPFRSDGVGRILKNYVHIQSNWNFHSNECIHDFLRFSIQNSLTGLTE